MGLVEGYESVELRLAYPELRAGLEQDLKLICLGQRSPADVLREQIDKYREVYRVITERVQAMDASLAHRYYLMTILFGTRDNGILPSCFASFRLQAVAAAAPPPTTAVPTISPIFKCPKCKRHHMSIRAKKDNKGFFLSCLGKPECEHVIWLADVIKEIKALDQNCTKCRNDNKTVAIKFKSNSLLAMLNPSLINDNDRTYASCILCDTSLRVILEINEAQIRGTSASFSGNHSQANNRPIPSQGAVRTNANTSARPTNPRPMQPMPPPPPPRPNSNANQNAGDAARCTACNGPVITYADQLIRFWFIQLE